VSGFQIVRVLAAICGVVAMLFGVAVAATPGGIVAAAPPFLFGAALLIGAAIERARYRSESAERSGDAPGPGGGEAGGLEPRFERTDEVFIDPTTRRRMRVLVDRASGERRYLAED
jgi:hypothetical protein